MCLTLRAEENQPYEKPIPGKPTIRWKIIRLNKKRREYTAPYQIFRYKLNTWLKANTDLPDDSAGFHVFVDESPAKGWAGYKNSARVFPSLLEKWEFVWAKLYVRGFLKSGRYSGERCETWKEMKIVEIKKFKNT